MKSHEVLLKKIIQKDRKWAITHPKFWFESFDQNSLIGVCWKYKINIFLLFLVDFFFFLIGIHPMQG